MACERTLSNESIRDFISSLKNHRISALFCFCCCCCYCMPFRFVHFSSISIYSFFMFALSACWCCLLLRSFLYPVANSRHNRLSVISSDNKLFGSISNRDRPVRVCIIVVFERLVGILCRMYVRSCCRSKQHCKWTIAQSRSYRKEEKFPIKATNKLSNQTIGKRVRKKRPLVETDLHMNNLRPSDRGDWVVHALTLTAID